jgi:hypothetical protein
VGRSLTFAIVRNLQPLQPKSFLLTDLGITYILHPHTVYTRIKAVTIFLSKLVLFFKIRVRSQYDPINSDLSESMMLVHIREI